MEYRNGKIANAESHTHLQLLKQLKFVFGVRELRFALANTKAKNCKSVCLANAHFRISNKTSEKQAGRGKPAYNSNITKFFKKA